MEFHPYTLPSLELETHHLLQMIRGLVLARAQHFVWCDPREVNSEHTYCEFPGFNYDPNDDTPLTAEELQLIEPLVFHMRVLAVVPQSLNLGPPRARQLLGHVLFELGVRLSLGLDIYPPLCRS